MSKQREEKLQRNALISYRANNVDVYHLQVQSVWLIGENKQFMINYSNTRNNQMFLLPSNFFHNRRNKI